MRLSLKKTFIAAAWLALCTAAPATEYPTRPVKVIIPLGAGGGGDVFTRALSDELQKAWGQSVVVENRTGGALNIGARACAEAPADGYTICVLSSEPVIYNQARSPLFPDIPTLPEAYGGEHYPSTWFGLFAPAGTPKPIITKLADAVERILDDRDFRQRMFIDRAVEPAGMRLVDFARFIDGDRKIAERMVKEAGLTPQ